MARAMRGWGPWKPKATRVMRRILVLVDSIRAFERPLSRAASIAAVLDDASLQGDERFDATTPSPQNPVVEGLFAGVAFEHEDGA